MTPIGDLADLIVKRAERAEAELMSTRAALKIANATIATLQAQAALDRSEIESLQGSLQDAADLLSGALGESADD